MVNFIEKIGIIKLFLSAKATFALIVLGVCAVVALHGQMSIPFATCVSTISGIYMWVHSQNDQKAMMIQYSKDKIQ